MQRRAKQPGFHVGRQELLDHLPAELRLQRALRELPSIAGQRQNMARLVKIEPEGGKALMLHRLQEVRLRQPLRTLCIEASAHRSQSHRRGRAASLRPARAQPSGKPHPPALYGVAHERDNLWRGSYSVDPFFVRRGCHISINHATFVLVFAAGSRNDRGPYEFRKTHRPLQRVLPVRTVAGSS